MELVVIDDALLKEAESKLSSSHAYLNVELTTETVGGLKDISLELAKISKALETTRQEYVRPALDEQKRINEFFKAPIVALDDLSKKIFNRVNDFYREEIKKENERLAIEAKKLAEDLLAGKPLTPITESSAFSSTTPIPKVSETKYWDYEINDISKVPLEYLMVNHTKVDEAIRAGNREIRGLYISQKTRTVRR